MWSAKTTEKIPGTKELTNCLLLNGARWVRPQSAAEDRACMPRIEGEESFVHASRDDSCQPCTQLVYCVVAKVQGHLVKMEQSCPARIVVHSFMVEDSCNRDAEKIHFAVQERRDL